MSPATYPHREPRTDPLPERDPIIVARLAALGQRSLPLVPQRTLTPLPSPDPTPQFAKRGDGLVSVSHAEYWATRGGPPSQRDRAPIVADAVVAKPTAARDSKGSRSRVIAGMVITALLCLAVVSVVKDAHEAAAKAAIVKVATDRQAAVERAEQAKADAAQKAEEVKADAAQAKQQAADAAETEALYGPNGTETKRLAKAAAKDAAHDAKYGAKKSGKKAGKTAKRILKKLF